MPLVLDSSVAVTWHLPDEAAQRTLHVLHRLASEPGFVPAVWHAEVTNVMLVAERRGRTTPEQTVRGATALMAMSLRVDDQPFPSLRVLELARRHQLTAYDATYLELAIRHNADLATLDEPLRRAATAEGVTVVP